MSKRGGAPPPGLEVGVLVEATPHALKGCWYEAEVLELVGADVLLAFTAYKSEECEDGGPQQEWHKAREVRWTPPEDPVDGFPALLDRSDRCELRYEDGWWECTVFSIHPDPNGGPTEFVLRPTHYNEKHRVSVDRMRPPWTWRNDEWNIAYNSKARHVETFGPPVGGPRRPAVPTLPPGVAHLARVEHEAPVVKGVSALKTRGIDEEGYGPPEARPSSFAEGTWRPGLDGRQWVVVHSPENGASVWALKDQASFFIERAKREQLQKKEKKKRETKAAALAATIKAQQQSVVQQYQLRATAVQGGGAGKHKGGKQPGAKDRATAEHDRVLRILGAILRTHGEIVLSRISADVLQLSPSSASGFAGVYAREKDGFFDVHVGGRNLGRCDSALKAGQLRALYVQLASDLAAIPLGMERNGIAHLLDGVEPPPPLHHETAIELSPTLDGQILGRVAQLERQRQYAHVVATPKFRALLDDPISADADAAAGQAV